MIRLARSAALKRWIQGSRAASELSTRYVAGASAEAAVKTASALLSGYGIRSSLFFLGEYVDRRGLIDENVANGLQAAALLGRAGLDVHVSVDPTQIGYSVDPVLATRNAFAIAEAVAEASGGRPGVHAMMLDMEDETVTEATIAMHDELRAAKLPVALTLQAYLRRTEADLSAQIRRGARVRLVKGAFAPGHALAYATQHDVAANFRRLIDLMLSREARDAGFYPIFATHNARLRAYVVERAAANGWRPDEYEFEMLLGVSGDLARRLAERGQHARLYLPFGRDWWPYAARRLGENPRNVWLLAKSLLGADRVTR